MSNMDAKELERLEREIRRLKMEKEHADQMRALKLKEARYKLSAKMSDVAARHPFLTLPAVQAKRATKFALPHFGEETRQRFREVAKKLHNHMQRVASNKAFAEHLREGQTALNPETGDMLTKTKESGKGYIVTKRVKVRV